MGRSAAAGMAPVSCDLCEQRSGLYIITRTCCAMRLLRTTPQHGARKAMWQHLRLSLTVEQWEALRAAWKLEEPGTL